MKVVIVGGVAGGATAATRLRRLDEHAQITVFERSGYISYANCGLPYYIGGVIEDKEELTLQTPESIWNRFRIDMKVHHEVTDINAVKKTVTVYNLDTGKVYEESYDKLILSPGAKPIKPNLPGIDNDKIFTLRTVEDILKIRSFVEEKKPKTAVMVGGGFIGLEVAENLCDLGVKVTVVQRPKQLMNTLDYDMASVTLLDTRTQGEYAKGHVDGFINIPVDDLRESLENMDKSKPVYVMCQSGLRSYISCRILAGEGFDCYNFSGGYRFYENVMRETNLIEASLPCGMDKQ